MQRELWQTLRRQSAGHDFHLPGGDLTKTLSFLPGLAADAFMPLLLADRGLHLARDASGRNRYARFEHILVPGRWHAQACGG